MRSERPSGISDAATAPIAATTANSGTSPPPASRDATSSAVHQSCVFRVSLTHLQIGRIGSCLQRKPPRGGPGNALVRRRSLPRERPARLNVGGSPAADAGTAHRTRRPVHPMWHWNTCDAESSGTPRQRLHRHSPDACDPLPWTAGCERKAVMHRPRAPRGDPGNAHSSDACDRQPRTSGRTGSQEVQSAHWCEQTARPRSVSRHGCSKPAS